MANEFSYADDLKRLTDIVDHQKEYIKALISGQETLQKYITDKDAEIERLKRKYDSKEKAYTAEYILRKELTEEIERLKEAIVSKNLTPIGYKVRQEYDEKHIHIINELKEEIERLQKEKFDSLNCQFSEMYSITLNIAVKKAKSEAIKDFAKEFVADLSHMITYDKDYIKAKIFHFVEIKTKEIEGGEADA